MSAEQIRELAKGNDAHVHGHKGSIHFTEFPNQKAIMIISCMDPRADPKDFWNLPFGPGVLRNAGGRAKDASRSIQVLSSIMAMGENTVGAVAVVHHTDCGMTHFPNDYIQNKVKGFAGDDAAAVEKAGKMDFLTFRDAEASVKEDAEILKNDPYLPKDIEVVGYVHDVFTGKTTEVISA